MGTLCSPYTTVTDKSVNGSVGMLELTPHFSCGQKALLLVGCGLLSLLAEFISAMRLSALRCALVTAIAP
jgi:hypothetical protein